MEAEKYLLSILPHELEEGARSLLLHPIRLVLDRLTSPLTVHPTRAPGYSMVQVAFVAGTGYSISSAPAIRPRRPVTHINQTSTLHPASILDLTITILRFSAGKASIWRLCFCLSA